MSAEPAELEERIYGELAEPPGLSHSELAPALYTVGDEAAAVHLFRVAAGLDSMVPGEAQILGQVREAYEAARETETAGRDAAPALPAGAPRRQARAHRDGDRREPGLGLLGGGAARRARLRGPGGRRILLLGAGKTADLTAANLISRGVGEIVVANRSPERARGAGAALRRPCRRPGRGRGRAAHADVVVASTSSQGFVLSAEQVERAMKERRGRPIFFIDIAVPRDVDPAVIELEGCYLYDIDDLERVVAESVAGRREEAVRAEAIVSEEADAFRAWQLSLDVVPAISSLRARAESIRREELERAEGRLASLSPSQRRAVEALTSQIVAKLLHQPTVRMKEAAAAADGVLYADAVRHLFGLGDDADQARKPRQ